MFELSHFRTFQLSNVQAFENRTLLNSRVQALKVWKSVLFGLFASSTAVASVASGGAEPLDDAAEEDDELEESEDELLDSSKASATAAACDCSARLVMEMLCVARFLL